MKEKMGAGSNVAAHIQMNRYRPSLEGGASRKDEADYLFSTLVFQDDADKRKMKEIQYRSNFGTWSEPVLKEV